MFYKIAKKFTQNHCFSYNNITQTKLQVKEVFNDVTCNFSESHISFNASDIYFYLNNSGNYLGAESKASGEMYMIYGKDDICTGLCPT